MHQEGIRKGIDQLATHGPVRRSLIERDHEEGSPVLFICAGNESDKINTSTM